MTFSPYKQENVVFGNDNPIYKSLVSVMSSNIGNIFLGRECNLAVGRFRELTAVSSDNILTDDVTDVG